jgi:cytochrome b involved in lipid metabolism
MSDRTITFEELKAHTTKDSLWLLISGKGKAESGY